MVSTEVLSASFKPGSRPQELLNITIPLPAVGSVFSGFVHDEPDRLRAFVDWESLEAHEVFQASDIFPPFQADFLSRSTGDFTLWHIDFKPSITAKDKALSAPVTEIMTFYFAGEPPSSFVEQALRFRQVLAQQSGFVEIALGVSVEEVSVQDKTGNPVVAVIGWDTEGSCRTFLGSSEYKEKRPGQDLGKDVLLAAELVIATLQPLRKEQS